MNNPYRFLLLTLAAAYACGVQAQSRPPLTGAMAVAEPQVAEAVIFPVSRGAGPLGSVSRDVTMHTLDGADIAAVVTPLPNTSPSAPAISAPVSAPAPVYAAATDTRSDERAVAVVPAGALPHFNQHAPSAYRLGTTTRQLLAAQASGRLDGRDIAGSAPPAFGATASRTWQRYVESFEYQVPQWFDEKIEVGN